MGVYEDQNVIKAVVYDMTGVEAASDDDSEWVNDAVNSLQSRLSV